MDRLGRRGGLFLEWASEAFGDGERHGRGELPEDNSSFVLVMVLNSDGLVGCLGIAKAL